jgi:HD superfamily phosphodiesterase
MTQRNKVIRRAMDYVNQLLIPLENHYYHQYSHALEVMDRAMYIAEKEGLNEDDIEMLGLA